MAPIRTNGGPQWQTIQIPFIKFLATNDFHLDMDQEARCANRRKDYGPLTYIDYGAVEGNKLKILGMPMFLGAYV